jgi:hypothetical protein
MRYTVAVGNLATDGDAPRYGDLPRQEIGRSVQARPILSHTAGDGDVPVLLIGGLHTGIEAPTAGLLAVLLERLASGQIEVPEGLRLVVAPLANPDGHALGVRLNARGVDLNRNWLTDDWASVAIHGETVVSGGDAPLSEPEVAALYALILDLQPALVVSYHGFAGLVEANSAGAAEELGAVYADAAGYGQLPEWVAYPITGELIDSMAQLGIAAFDVEMSDGSPETFERELAAIVVLLQHLAGLPR